jgi:hypothetical protein
VSGLAGKSRLLPAKGEKGMSRGFSGFTMAMLRKGSKRDDSRGGCPFVRPARHHSRDFFANT